MSDVSSQREHQTEVRIHIDKQHFDSPNPTTGVALYALGQIPEGVVLYRDLPGNQEDVEVLKDSAEIQLRNGEHFRSSAPHQKEITIVVNAKKKVVRKERLCFDELVALAFDPVPQGENIKFTITYRNGPIDNPKGTLIEGECVLIQEGMIFNVTQTDKS